MSRHLPKFVVFSLICLSFVSCSGQRDADPASQPNGQANGRGGGGRAGGGSGRRGGGAPVPVVTARVQTKSVPVTIPAVGTAEALSTVQIRAQITGQLSTVHFGEGQDVKKGQLLFSLDQRPFQAALQQAEAVLARDTATAKNAEQQHARYEDLYKRGLIPRDQYETQNASNESLQATLQADRAAVENAKLNLNYTRIVAPMSGRTGALGVHTGDLIRANDATPLVVINQVSPIYVTFAVPGRYLGQIRQYQAKKPLAVQARGQAPVAPGAQAPAPATPQPGLAQQVAPGQGATMPSRPGLVETGRVTFIDNAVDSTTGTIKLKGTFQNADQGLWPGLFVQVTLNLTDEPGSIVVPATAVQPSASGQFVYVVKSDRTAEVRPVTVSRQFGEEMIIANGLVDGEEVVTDGQLRLTPGAQVSTAGPRGGGAGEGGGQGGRGGRGRGASAGAGRGDLP
ncbi:MAG TPA: efflux RND transporter periplasmic adaptor subunit [Vicinamibacterales bacterium]|nr:efflux RND transporter periplasmic adaptor subunit [Vicinamibacterales bacterium]